MRPLVLTATAFGPFVGTVSLDLRTVADQRLFGIYGATGSGKTSILDAMTFALFGESSGSERQAGHLRCRQAPPETQTAVELVFEIAARRYLIRRTPDQQIAKQRGAGFTERKHEAYLFDCTDVPTDRVRFPDRCGKPLAEKKVTQVHYEVERLLGYTAEQFRQVVMLPQGRFRVFLSASSDERSHILRRLFDINVFERLTAGLKDRRRAIESARKEAIATMTGRLQQVGAERPDELSGLIDAARTNRSELEGQTLAARTLAAERQHALQDGRTIVQTYEQALGDHRAAKTVAAERAKMTQAAFTRLSQTQAELDESSARAEERAALQDRTAALLRWQTLLAQAESLRRDHAQSVELMGTAENALETASKHLETLRTSLSNAETAQQRDQEIRRLRAELIAQRDRTATECARLQETLVLLERQESNKNELAMARERLAAAAAEHNQVQEALEATTTEYLSNSALMLAASLQPGRPCPVCGSTEHPQPAIDDNGFASPAGADAGRITIEELRTGERTARTAVEKAQRSVDTHAATAKEIAGRLADRLPAEPNALEARVHALGTEIQEHDRRLAELETEAETVAVLAARLPALRDEIEGTELRKRRLETELSAAGRRETETAATLAERLRPIDEPLRNPDKLAEAHARAEQRSREAAEAHQRLLDAKVADERALERARAEQRAAVEAQQRAAERVATFEGTELPDIAALKTAAEAASAEHERLIEQSAQTRARVEALSEAQAAVNDRLARKEELGTELATVAFLAEAVDGRGENTFKTPLVDYALAVYFEQVLASANIRFAKMSRGRYELRRKQAPSSGRGKSGLEISVYDAYSDSERDAATLSGGEGFLASLALALGLSDVVQAESGGIRLDAIFIDEGFGHLDPEALDEALQTLLDLADGRAAGGHAPRSVGIISHVEEVKRAVPVGYEVVRGVRGSTVRLRSQQP